VSASSTRRTTPSPEGGCAPGPTSPSSSTTELITARTDFAAARNAHPDAEVVDLRDGVLLPGLIDTHVHLPQVRAIGHLGKPLLEWLDQCALPEEERLGDARLRGRRWPESSSRD
jgi:cytosine/adenosine deaminase-related metal-dependent hydrolase